MAVIKQIQQYTGSAWVLQDIGAQATNVSLANGTSAQTAITTLQTQASDFGNRISTLEGYATTTANANGHFLIGDSTNTVASSIYQPSDILTLQNNISTLQNNKVSKSGDTMTGSLNLQDTSVFVKSSNVSPDNAQTYGGGYFISGDDDYNLNHVVGMQAHSYDSESGFIVANRLYASTSNDNINNSLELGVDIVTNDRVVIASHPTAWAGGLVPSAGAATAWLGQLVPSTTLAASWRTALKVIPDDRVVIANNASKSVASGSNVNLTSHTFSTGIWLISYYVSFASNKTGRRAAFIGTSATGGALQPYNNNQQATDGATTVISYSQTMDVSSSTTRYFNVYQSSGSALTTYYTITAIKLLAI